MAEGQVKFRDGKKVNSAFLLRSDTCCRVLRGMVSMTDRVLNLSAVEDSLGRSSQALSCCRYESTPSSGRSSPLAPASLAETG